MTLKSKADLDQAIIRLTQLKEQQQQEVVFLFKETTHSLNPVNMVKEKISNLTGPGEARTDILTTVANMAAGMLTKKLVIGKTNNLVSSFIGNLIKTGTFSLLQGHAEEIKAYGTSIYHNLFEKKDRD